MAEDDTASDASATIAGEDVASTSGDAPPTEDGRVYLVPYGWWSIACKSINAEGLRGVPYMATPPPATSYGSKLVNMFNSDQVFNLQRDIDEEGEDVSGQSYALIASDMWSQALKWYRELGKEELKEKNLPIEGLSDVYDISLRISVIRSTSIITVKISRKDNTLEVHRKASKIFSGDSDPVRIWDFSGQTELILMNAWNRLPQDVRQPDQEILLHVHALDTASSKNESKQDEPSVQSNKTAGFFYGGSIESSGNGRSLNHDSELFNGGLQAVGLGLVGLENLGNTCYMNSALQCLVHTTKLVVFFLGDFTKEVNHHNPLGARGELALAFGDLLRRLWSPDKTPVAPRHFKGKLAHFAPQFRGYNQHDSQELLAFLLDGLHEDLNRVKQKPYIEIKDADGQPDEEVADEHWQYHLSRNNSIIVDTCQGQYKSTLVCPICKKVSITFDPFMYLSLPLSPSNTRTMTMMVIGTDGTIEPSQHTISVPKSAELKHFIQGLGSSCLLRDSETLLIASVYNNRIVGYLEGPSDSISLIRDGDRLAVYRLQKDSDAATILVFVHQRQETIIRTVTRWKQFGTPLATRLQLPLTGTTIRAEFLKAMNPFLRSNHSASCSSNSDSNTCHASEPDKMTEDLDLFEFYLTDERCQMQLSKVETNEPVSNDITKKQLHVLVNWSEKALERYNLGLLNSLPEVYKSGGIFARRTHEPVSLYSCLDAFLSEEPLGPDDMWYCPSCKEHRQANKKLDLWRLPEVLIIHLKRFSYNRFMKHKLDTTVEFPIHDLDLSGHISHKPQTATEGEIKQLSMHYRLYAVSNHYGSMGGGHYTAQVFHECGNKWYNFDDSRVSQISEESIKTSAAYVLFYRRI
ncbi:ubiquitin carboxyl-terminal hydrolase 8-like isoform X2 [Carex rostrata]